MQSVPTTFFAIATETEAIGSIALTPEQGVHRFKAELGYWLAEPFWGRGIMTEADIVDKLRQNCTDLLSLVAVQNNRIVGHILFSPARIEGERIVEGMGLAPMAVLPEYQRSGIGSLLVKSGIDKPKSRDCPFIIVLGHPEYYLRFGFEFASNYGIRCQWDGIPDEAFMMLILNKPAMSSISGVARYRKEFDEAI